MKNKVLSIFLVLMDLLPFSGIMAQELEIVHPKGLPGDIQWNLAAKEMELSLKDYEYPIPASWNIHQRPEIEKLKLVYVKARSFDLNGNLLDQAKKRGLKPCPNWVPVQIYLEKEYLEPAVWFPLDQLGEIPRVGCKHSKAWTSSCTKQEFFPDNPRRVLVTDVFVFTTTDTE